MNIVKGVADLLRRSSGGQAGEAGSWSNAEKFSAPSARIQFSDIGEEAVLNTLWHKYETTIEKTEKRKLLQVFLLHFSQTYKNWDPVYDDQLAKEQAPPEDIVIGCSYGHPSEVILILIQEIARITSFVTELNNNSSPVSSDHSEPSINLSFSTDGLYVLNCMTIITRSMHNCKVFSYYGGVQKVTALLKASIVQLKTLTSALVVDEQLSSCSMEKTRILQKILLYVVSIIYSFMELHLFVHDTSLLVDIGKHTFSRGNLWDVPSSSVKDTIPEARFLWQQKAIVLVMEAGGVNWLVGKSSCGLSED